MIIYSGKAWKIIQINDKYVIRDFYIETDSYNKIINIVLNDPHPNCDPETNLFCIPNNLYKIEFNETSLNLIENMIQIYHLDSCYFTPWNYIKWIPYSDNVIREENEKSIISKIIDFFKKI